MLFLRRPDSPFQISPCAVTTSSPRQRSRALPKRSTCVPPALVARLPPMVQLPSAARLSANRKPARCAASCKACKTQPASAVIVRLLASTSRTAFMRERLSTTCVPEPSGVDPATSPVLPPCGTIETSATAQALTTAATSFAEPGRTTHNALPCERLRQSTSHALRSPASNRLASPTIPRSCATSLLMALVSAAAAGHATRRRQTARGTAAPRSSPAASSNRGRSRPAPRPR